MKNKIISGFAVIFFLSCSDNSSLEFPSEKEWLEKWFPGSSSSALLGSSSSVPVGSSSSTGSSSSIGSSVGSAARSCGTDKTYEPANQICDERDTPKVYNIMTVEGKTWMAENLNYAASGSKCGTGTGTISNYDKLIDENTDYCDKFGRLYNWATAMALDDRCNNSNIDDCTFSDVNHKGICPDEWRIPNAAELGKLMNYLLDKDKSKLLLGGYGQNNRLNSVYDEGHWWTSMSYDPNTAVRSYYRKEQSAVNQERSNKVNYLSVRCVKDN